MPQQQLTPYSWNIIKLFDNHIFRVPVYQRPYSWNIENVDTLLLDIWNSFDNDISDEYYMGNILLQDDNEKINGSVIVYSVIDGQQRLSTLSLCLLSLYSLAVSKKADVTDACFIELKRSLWKAVSGRNPEKNHKSVELNSVDKECFDELFNYGFDHPDKLYTYANDYKCKTLSDENIIKNFEEIYSFLSCKFENKSCDALLDFANYFLYKVCVIAIECHYKPQKVFSMFDSLNSKGRRLEEIDLIKSYIFSNFDEESYDEYLKKWGCLITETNNNIYDYFYTYIKAFISFYRQNINITNFKCITQNNLITYFKKDNLSDTLKAFIDDMVEKVEFYSMLIKKGIDEKIININRFRFYFRLFKEMKYQHPKPLFFRLFVELNKNQITKKDFVDIFEQIVKYMMKFTNIANGESKNIITLFAKIMNDIYSLNKVEKKRIFAFITNETIFNSLTDDKISTDLKSVDCYTQKKIGAALLALYNCHYVNSNGNIAFKYDEAYSILDNFETLFSLDHMLPQHPKPEDSSFYYYARKSNKNEFLVLKENSDFPKDIVKEDMDYDLFTHNILNKIGNLQLKYRDDNAIRQNSVLVLPECKLFHTYKEIVDRENLVVTFLVENVLKTPEADLSLINKTKTSDLRSINMETLIKEDCVHIGDKLYIVRDPENSVAELVDANDVIFNNQKMSLNEWGCKVTGWKSIRIYQYVAIVGDNETLLDKRKRLFEPNKIA